MPRREPDHRAYATRVSPTPPEHPFELAMWHELRGRSVNENVSRAMELHQSEVRDCLRGWLLATKDDAEIADRTRLAFDTIRAYRHLFFDVTAFRDHFDLVAWAKQLTLDPNATPEGLQFIRWAVMYGVEAIAYMSGLEVNVDARKVQEQAMIEGHFRGLMGRDANIDSGAAREALKHQQMAVSQAAVLAKTRPPSAKDFAVKLKHREMTRSIEVIDKTREVLH